MKITKKDVVNMIMKYLNRDINLIVLVNWAENGIMEAEIDDANYETLRDIIARIGLSDVKEFGLTWDDCYEYLNLLGYNPKIELIPA